jgi:transposase
MRSAMTMRLFHARTVRQRTAMPVAYDPPRTVSQLVMKFPAVPGALAVARNDTMEASPVSSSVLIGSSTSARRWNADAKLSGALRMLLAQLKLELDHLDLRIDEADALIKKTACENEACQRLMAIPGIGPVTATAVIAAIGNGGAFRKGREFAAWMGVVPREHSTGGKQKLLGISKRGNSYLRRLFVQGARAVMQQRTKQSSGLSRWLAQLTSRTHRDVAGVALANKLARMAWAVLAKNEPYRPPVLADVAAA